MFSVDGPHAALVPEPTGSRGVTEHAGRTLFERPTDDQRFVCGGLTAVFSAAPGAKRMPQGSTSNRCRVRDSLRSVQGE